MKSKGRDRLLTLYWCLFAAFSIVWINGYLFEPKALYAWRFADGGFRTVDLSLFNGDIVMNVFTNPAGNNLPIALKFTGFRETFERNQSPSFVDRRSPTGFFVATNSLNEKSNNPWSVLIGVPFWLVTLILLMLIFLRRRVLYRRELKMPDQLCINCGYDLRASKDSCPECGQVISSDAEKPKTGLSTP